MFNAAHWERNINRMSGVDYETMGRTPLTDPNTGGVTCEGKYH